MNKTIIALTGAPGSGKSEVRKILTQDYGFWPVRVASPLKDMARALGLDERHIEGPLKETETPRLAGATPRRLMQALGRELPDALGVPDLWGWHWAHRARECIATRIVVEDHRYPYEHDFFTRVGKTQVWNVNRPDHAPAGEAMQHQAETQVLPWDRQVWNGGTLEDLRKNVSYLMEFVK